MKKLLLTASIGCVMLLPLAAQAQRIGLSMPSIDTFKTILKNGVEEAAKSGGVTLQVEDAQGDVGRQLNQVQNMVAQRYDAIIVNPVDTDVTPRITKMASEAGIPLVYLNRRPVDFEKLPKGVVYVGSNEKGVSGTLQAKEVCRLLNGTGNLLLLMGDLSNEAARTRTKDVEDVLATKECSGLKIVDRREGKWSRTSAQDITTNWLTAGLKFDAVISNNDEMALGAINALKAAGRWTPNMVVAGIDATPDALASMRSGGLKVTVFQDARTQGVKSLEAAVSLVRKQSVDKFVNIPFQLVTPDNSAKFGGKS